VFFWKFLQKIFMETHFPTAKSFFPTAKPYTYVEMELNPYTPTCCLDATVGENTKIV